MITAAPLTALAANRGDGRSQSARWDRSPLLGCWPATALPQNQFVRRLICSFASHTLACCGGRHVRARDCTALGCADPSKGARMTGALRFSQRARPFADLDCVSILYARLS